MEKYVFISYKSEENSEANWVKNVLMENGISCWMAPESIPGGSSYAEEIQEAIKNCTVFVLILSEKAQESPWVKKELDRAISDGKIVFPFMIENCQLHKAFNYYLTDVQRYAAYESKVTVMEKMVRELKVILGEGDNAVKEPKDVHVDTPVNEGEKKLPKKKNFLISLTPYGRKDANDKKKRFIFHVSSVFAVIDLILYGYFWFEELYRNGDFGIIITMLCIVAFVLCTWNLTAWICAYASKIKVMFKPIAIILCWLVNLFSLTLFLLLLCCVLYLR